MENKTIGTIISVKKQWWLKINTKPIRINSLDGAIFPHIIKVRYEVAGKEFFKRKWINAGKSVPAVGDSVKILYCEEKPNKSKVEI